MKICTNCQCELPLTEFFKRKDSAVGYRSHCKRCLAEQTKKYSRRNRSRELELGRLYREHNREQCMLSKVKNRAKRKNLDFNLTLDDIHIPEYCPVLGLKLEMNVGKAQDNSASLDRIDPNKGYIKGNVQVMSRRANVLKNNGTLEEFEKLILHMRKLGI